MHVCENHEWKSIVQETLKGDVFWNNQGHADSIQTLGFMSSHLGFTSLPFCKKKKLSFDRNCFKLYKGKR